MSTVTPPGTATLDDLRRIEEKAELIDGRIVHLMPTGFRPHRIALRIALQLEQYSEQSGRGVAFGDNMGFAVPRLSSGRESFSPDAAWYDGDLPDDEMDFVHGPPTFAVEVRSKRDYGPASETALADKRSDYFEAGTQVVWDVDPQQECIRCYRPGAPNQPQTFHRTEEANAEPALPGWTISVDKLFLN